MMNYQIFENKDFEIVFSDDITNYIKSIKKYNQSNGNAIKEWSNHIAWLIKKWSSREFVWRYGSNETEDENDYIKVDDGIYNITFRLENDTEPPYVYVFDADLQHTDYGLETPPSFKESVNSINIQSRYKSLFDYITEGNSNLKSLKDYIMEHQDR